jgi:hypothetical protein
MNCLAVDFRGYDNSSRFVILSIRNAHFVEIENQPIVTPLDGFIQILDCSMEEGSRYLEMLLFLSDAFWLDDLCGVAKNKRLYPAPSDWSLKLTREYPGFPGSYRSLKRIPIFLS